MAKQAVVSEAKPSLWMRTRDFYQEVMAEMSKVTWPTQDELKTNTSVVVMLVVIFSTVIFVFDRVFGFGVMMLFRAL